MKGSIELTVIAVCVGAFLGGAAATTVHRSATTSIAVPEAATSRVPCRAWVEASPSGSPCRLAITPRGRVPAGAGLLARP